MRVVVDFDLCESNALCMKAAPEVFEVREDDFLYILDEHPPERLRKKVEQAVRQCPKQAISIEEVDGSSKAKGGEAAATGKEEAPRSQSGQPDENPPA
jgi:ferredoxin